MPLNVVVTGANAGLGLELCKQLTARGDVVYASCRAPTAELEAVGVKKIIHDVDVTADDAGDRLARALDGVRVDAVINNAGGLGSNPGRSWDEQFEDQKFATLDFRVMQRAFEVNTLGPIRVTKALTPKLKESKGKVLIVTSLMGSISDNGSGGAMAYRCAKAAVNMAAATMASELREAGVAVGLVHPGMLKTNFGGGTPPANMMKWFKPVEGGGRGVLMALDALTMETTGSFVHGNYGEGLKPCPW
ncbi:uncharacterized protein MICPUCDRAFT_60347 [Micromonas pusilla CCMP1545]|uniref:Predicted protein n=1 Tax=Micromonas pusilla (strain CCMP1545) TaxID=564608 RepID=C1MY00_MICPC|nr:uncharacterized protein MICPUCDRAFT_60347 [Micromonas pusilla CCMP1545]EEH55555.1 predicted protein [Micromonas pusilla CCMP1545]|eukprot:XP_003060786.1 predicted protein [Micromonas pusilla CCMP1545]